MYETRLALWIRGLPRGQLPELAGRGDARSRTILKQTNNDLVLISMMRFTRRAFCRNGAALATSVLTDAAQTRPPARIRAFRIDFNWNCTEGLVLWINTFAKPGLWADADPHQHVDWYAKLGANVIQTFAVSGNGYAWDKDGAVPPPSPVLNPISCTKWSAWATPGR